MPKFKHNAIATPMVLIRSLFLQLCEMTFSVFVFDVETVAVSLSLSSSLSESSETIVFAAFEEEEEDAEIKDEGEVIKVIRPVFGLRRHDS